MSQTHAEFVCERCNQSTKRLWDSLERPQVCDDCIDTQNRWEEENLVQNLQQLPAEKQLEMLARFMYRARKGLHTDDLHIELRELTTGKAA